MSSASRRNISTLSSPPILVADHAAPCREAFGRTLLHPLGELRRTHQTGLHRHVSDVRGRDHLLVTICRRGETAEYGDDLDHDDRTSSRRPAASFFCCSLTGSACGKMPSYIARAFRIRPVRSRSGFGINRTTGKALLLEIDFSRGKAYPRQADARITLQKLPRRKDGSLSARTSAFTLPKVVSGLCLMPS
jgi:hypothetical protein